MIRRVAAVADPPSRWGCPDSHFLSPDSWPEPGPRASTMCWSVACVPRMLQGAAGCPKHSPGIYCTVQKRQTDKAVLRGVKFRMQNDFVIGIHGAEALLNVRELGAASPLRSHCHCGRTGCGLATWCRLKPCRRRSFFQPVHRQ